MKVSIKLLYVFKYDELCYEKIKKKIEPFPRKWMSKMEPLKRDFDNVDSVICRQGRSQWKKCRNKKCSGRQSSYVKVKLVFPYQ